MSASLLPRPTPRLSSNTEETDKQQTKHGALTDKGLEESNVFLVVPEGRWDLAEVRGLLVKRVDVPREHCAGKPLAVLDGDVARFCARGVDRHGDTFPVSGSEVASEVPS